MAGTSVLLSVAGVLATQVIKSPAQAVADTAPPSPSVITAPVEYRVLKDSVIIRGTVSSEQSVDITPSASGPDAGAAIVTRVPVKPRQPVKAGQLLLEVSGRPVIALRGTLPMYRDLKPGAQGDDIAQLQSSLEALGHRTAGDCGGCFGPRTKEAVTALYEDLGYTPLPAQPDEDLLLEEAQDQVLAARRGLEDLPASASAKQTDRAAGDLRKAQERLSRAEAKSGPTIPVSELVFLTSFPARVDSVTARAGTQSTGKVLTLSTGKLVINGALQTHQKGLVQAGEKVEILSELTGATSTGTVASVSDVLSDAQSSPDGDSAAAPVTGGRGYPVVVKPMKSLPLDLAGQDVRLTVEAASTRRKALIVPVSAVSAGTDGRTSVTVLMPDGSRRRVQVTTGTSGDGQVQLIPAAGQRLAEGERVVIGVRSDRAGGPGK
ncbi:HlyD family secretion protein [Streptomyces brevispora]|uniref:peptidoglycan-binding protein n=1 Tax=Streptomyces brevispora TaxID=887462 RepID=UPI002E31919A|nr:peptidoglycan-binding protein [Streptomyces brevispora]